MDRLRNKVALVTGAGAGLGRAQALMLAREGAAVVVTDIDRDSAEAVAAEIEAGGGQALFLEQDVARDDVWAKTMEETLRRFGKLDVLVNNAGVGFMENVEETSLEKWRWLMSINLDGVFLGTKHAIAVMKGRGGGSIINLSSIEGLVGDPNLAAYNASKGGVRLFTKSAALHCARAGYRIRVNSVHPAYIWTPMVEDSLKALGDVEAGRKALEALHPIGHMGEPDDVAYGIVYLASDESKFVTGTELVIDGGYTAQ